jgi:hypothetical protein
MGPRLLPLIRPSWAMELKDVAVNVSLHLMFDSLTSYLVYSGDRP